MIPAAFSLGNPGNGITAQARSQAAALQRRGHGIVFMNPWEYRSLDSLDVVQFFLGGFGTYGIEGILSATSRTLLVMAPIIDSNEPNWKYRAAVAAGSTFGRIFTVPGVLARQARASDLVVCRSEHERNRVIEALCVDPPRAVVVLNGGDVPETSPEMMHKVKESYGLPDRFVLNVSAYTQERKNALRLAQAVERLGLPLVLAGHDESTPIGRKLEELARRNPALRLLGFVDRATRDALYGLCHVFALPSYHEGTGLAALEAGAAGARIVITRNGGPPDYFRKWAQYVDPLDIRQLCNAIEHEWKQAENHELATHIRTSLSWDASAQSLEQAYRSGLGRKGQCA